MAEAGENNTSRDLTYGRCRARKTRGENDCGIHSGRKKKNRLGWLNLSLKRRRGPKKKSILVGANLFLFRKKLTLHQFSYRAFINFKMLRDEFSFQYFDVCSISQIFELCRYKSISEIFLIVPSFLVIDPGKTFAH